MNPHLRREDRASRRAPGDHHTGANNRLEGATTPAFLVEHELGRGQRWAIGVDRPRRVVEAEDRVHRNGVHARLVVGVEGSHVPPVALLPLGLVGDLVVAEVVDPSHTLRDQCRDDVATDVVPGGLTLLGVAGDDVTQHLGIEDVVPHRNVRLIGDIGK